MRRPAARRWSTVVAVVVAAGAAAAFLLVLHDVADRGFLSARDPGGLARLARHRPEDAIQTARLVTDLGTPAGVALVGVAGALLLRHRGARWVAALAPLVGAVLAGLVATALKAWVVPVRPPSGLRLPFEQDPTFPSGHTAAATALYVGFGLAMAVTCRSTSARRLAVLGGAATSVAVGASRLVLAVHWPTDVLGGWALGTAVAVAGWLLASRTGRRRPGRASAVERTVASARTRT